MTESRTAQETPHLDPFDFWRQVYEANEQTWTKAMKEVLTSQGYAEAQGKMLETFLAFQKMMRDGMTAQLKTLNIPTRDDVARLGELLVGVEEKLDQVEERLDGIEERLSALDARIARQQPGGNDQGGQPQAAAPSPERRPHTARARSGQAEGSDSAEKTG